MKITIHNWEKWQTYRQDRNAPPWIKLHRCCLRNHKWSVLSNEERGQLVVMWAIAADHGGVIKPPNGCHDAVSVASWIARVGMMDTVPDLERFVSLEFIDVDATLAPEWRQGDAPESDAESDPDAESEAETVTSDRPTQPALRPPAKPKRKISDEERLAPWIEWKAAATADLVHGGITAAQIEHFASELEQCLSAYYDARGGRLTPTRLGYVGRELAKCNDPQTGLVAIEIFCDTHGASKDERYLAGIARRLERTSDDEFAVELKRHRTQNNGRGLWSGRPRS